MNSKAAYILFFVLNIAFCEAHAQQSASTEPAQAKISENIQSIHEKEKALQNKGFTKIDSLSSKSATLLENATDSLNNLSSSIQGKVQSKIDSLQQQLNEIKDKGNPPSLNSYGGRGQLFNATEKADKITRRIDSLQNVLSNKLQLDKLNKYVGETNMTDKLKIPELDKLSLPGMQDLNMEKLGIKNISLPNNDLKSMVDDQLGKIRDLKNTDWIKPDESGYQIPNEVQEYSELLKDPSTIDQTIDSKVAQMSEFQALNNETQELAAMKDLPESMLADLKRYQDTQAMKAEAKEVAIKKATDYFANHQDKLSQAQGMMSKLKKKYSYVPDSRDLSTAVKATSLKNEPLKKRLPARRFRRGLWLRFSNPAHQPDQSGSVAKLTVPF